MGYLSSRTCCPGLEVPVSSRQISREKLNFVSDEAVRTLVRYRQDEVTKASTALAECAAVTDQSTANEQAMAALRSEEAHSKLAATLNACTRNGWSGLMWAAYYGPPETVAVLVDARADLNLSLPDGRTALDLANVNPKNGKSVEVITNALAQQKAEAERYRGLLSLITVRTQEWRQRAAAASAKS